MSNTITLKKSGVSGNAPSSSDLSLGEIALNYADGHLYYKSGSSETPAKINSGDADTVDGLHASSFVKTSGDSVISGSLIVDDITINASNISDAGTLYIDAGGDIHLDADGGDIKLEDGGSTFGSLSNSGQNFQIIASTNDKDIQFKGFDNGTSITALTLDMSDAGAANFGGNMSLGTGKSLYMNGSNGLRFLHDGTDGLLINSTGDFKFSNGTSDKDIIFRGSDGGSMITALTLDMSAGGNAIFNGNVTTGNNGNFNIPTAASGNANLHFNGSDFKITSNSSSANLKLQTNSTTRLTINAAGNATFTGTVTATSFHGDGSNLTGLPSSTDNTKLPLAGGTMSGAIAMGSNNITGVGNVGIGVASPDHELHVVGDVTIDNESSSVPSMLHFNAKNKNNLDPTARINFWEGDSHGNTYTDSNAFIEYNGSTAGGGDGYLSIGGYTTGGANQDVMVINRQGRVGIGTSTPATTLHVDGQVRVDNNEGVAARKIRSSYFSSSQNLDLVCGASASLILGDGTARLTLASDDSATFAGDIIVDTPTGNSQTSHTLKLKKTNSGGSVQVGAEITASPYATNTNGGNLVFKTANTSVAATTALTLDGAQNAIFAGNVGIGSASPTTALDVNGDVTITNKLIHAGDTDTFLEFTNNTITLDAGGEEHIKIEVGGITINEGGQPNDFRIEGDGDTHLFFVDGSADKVGIGAASPSTILEVSGSGAGAAGIDLSQGESSTISNRLFFSTGTASQGIAMYNLSGSLVFGTSAQPANTSGDARMYLTSSGELGIGATPQSKLHVTAGDIRIDNNQQYLAETAAGGTIGVAKMDGSDNLLIGDGNLKIDVTGTSPRLTIDSSGNSTVHGNLTVSGGLTVDGTTTTVNSTTVQVDDKNIELGTVSTPSDTTADGGGITLKGATDKTINWVNSTDAWTFSERVAVPAGSAASPALTFSSDTDTGVYRFTSGSNDHLGFSTGGVLRGHWGPAGLQSSANVYTAATSEFRNYSGVWKGTTGLTGNGFQFINSADGTAMTLSSTGAMVVSTSVSTPDLSLTGLSAQNSEATALMINGSNEVGTRELGSNAFTSTSFQTTLSGSNRLNAQFVGDGSVSNTELDYLDGATSNIQNQLNLKAALASPALTGNPTAPTQSSSENSTKIATTAFVKNQGYVTSTADKLSLSGGTITGNVIFNDNKKAIFGTSSDGLEIYHDQSNSYINDTGTGDLIIKGGNDIVFQDAVGNVLANMNQSNSVELYYGGSKKFETTADGISLHGSGYIDLPDNGRARFGASQDLAIWHDGSNSYIRDESGTGDLIVSTNAFRLKSANAGETMMTAFEDGAVNLYHNNVQKLSTFASGISVTGSVNADQLHLGDSDKALFGNSNDLEIYHDGSNSIIKDSGTGGLFLLADAATYIQTPSGESKAKFTKDGSVELYYDNSKKFETTSGGVTVTGHLSATTKSFLVDNPKTGGKLQYGVVESNEHGVYVRGKTDQEEIELPEEWEWLVDEDSVTVDLTPIGQMQHLFIIEQNNTKVKVGGLAENGQYNYVIYGTRKDVDPLEVNI